MEKRSHNPTPGPESAGGLQDDEPVVFRTPLLAGSRLPPGPSFAFMRDSVEPLSDERHAEIKDALGELNERLEDSDQYPG